MEKSTPEKNNQSADTQTSSPEALPQEEPIILNKLFPEANKDLDALFPDQSLKKLLKEVAQIRKKNEKFLRTLRCAENFAATEED